MKHTKLTSLIAVIAAVACCTASAAVSSLRVAPGTAYNVTLTSSSADAAWTQTARVEISPARKGVRNLLIARIPPKRLSPPRKGS